MDSDPFIPNYRTLAASEHSHRQRHRPIIHINYKVEERRKKEEEEEEEEDGGCVVNVQYQMSVYIDCRKSSMYSK